jgi:hypothetical protein
MVKKARHLNRREADVCESAYCDYTEREGAYSGIPRTCKLGCAMMELVYCFDFKSTGNNPSTHGYTRRRRFAPFKLAQIHSDNPISTRKTVTEEPGQRHMKRRVSLREMSKHSCEALRETR